MIQWVYENTADCNLVDQTIVATDSEEIRSAVSGFGGVAVMTSPDHETGTDRIAEAAENIDNPEYVDYRRHMDQSQTIKALAALAQESRLQAFRLLVRSGPDGLAAGEIARRLDVPHNTLSSHLAILANAGLLTSHRQSRSIIYRIDFDGTTSNGLMRVGFGVDRVTGIFREEVSGLHKPLGTNKDIGLKVEGAFRLDRISLIDTLNAL